LAKLKVPFRVRFVLNLAGLGVAVKVISVTQSPADAFFTKPNPKNPTPTNSRTAKLLNSFFIGLFFI
jgi:hypothetical protein